MRVEEKKKRKRNIGIYIVCTGKKRKDRRRDEVLGYLTESKANYKSTFITCRMLAIISLLLLNTLSGL